jgi:hypothetical protein
MNKTDIKKISLVYEHMNTNSELPEPIAAAIDELIQNRNQYRLRQPGSKDELAERILTDLAENGYIDENYPEIYSDDGADYNEELDLKIQNHIKQEILKRL